MTSQLPTRARHSNSRWCYLAAIALALCIAGPELQRRYCTQAAVRAVERMGGSLGGYADIPSWASPLVEMTSTTWLFYTPDILGFDGTRDDLDAPLPPFDALRDLQWLSLKSSKVTDCALARIIGPTNPQYVDLEGTGITDAGLVPFRSLTRIEALDLTGTQVTDAGLAHLTNVRTLTYIELDSTKITDAGLHHLTKLPRLEALFLHKTQITDSGVAQLTARRTLTGLRLDDTRITDAALIHLARLKKLQWVNLCGTRVTAAGIAELKRTRPNLEVISRPQGDSPET